MGAPDFLNDYARLPDRLFHRQGAEGAPAPHLVALNTDLAASLGMDVNWLRGADGLALLSGTTTPDGALAQAYAGHQFGNFVPQLGDGRALLLGELATPKGLRDVQLKGSGRTPYSRGGDGRAWVGPILREYLMSEAMHALNVPTTRALAAVTTGAIVHRDAPLPGAILTRVATSHIRVGTFEYLAARGDTDGLQALCTYTLARHSIDGDRPRDLLRHTIRLQAELVAKWMSVGFIHGVMNTDNCALSGETIDYGPAAFMDGYHPAQVFSAIDQRGRYAYGNQPKIAQWNLAQLANALIYLEPDADAAVQAYTADIQEFDTLYQTAWRAAFAAKLGLADPQAQDDALITDVLDRMAAEHLDFTQCFATLATAPDPRLGDWIARWQARRAPDFATRMARANPWVVPRLHLIEAAIQAALAQNMAPFHALLAAVTDPFTPRMPDDPMTLPPRADQRVLRTTCGT